MKAVIFANGQFEGTNVLSLEGGMMMVLLEDYTDREHVTFAAIPITQQLPNYIKCGDWWYGLSGSYNETLPDGQKPRNYYRKEDNFIPPKDSFAVIAEKSGQLEIHSERRAHLSALREAITSLMRPLWGMRS